MILGMAIACLRDLSRYLSDTVRSYQLVGIRSISLCRAACFFPGVAVASPVEEADGRISERRYADLAEALAEGPVFAEVVELAFALRNDEGLKEWPHAAAPLRVAER